MIYPGRNPPAQRNNVLGLGRTVHRRTVLSPWSSTRLRLHIPINRYPDPYRFIDSLPLAASPIFLFFLGWIVMFNMLFLWVLGCCGILAPCYIPGGVDALLEIMVNPGTSEPTKSLCCFCLALSVSGHAEQVCPRQRARSESGLPRSSGLGIHDSSMTPPFHPGWDHHAHALP